MNEKYVIKIVKINFFNGSLNLVAIPNLSRKIYLLSRVKIKYFLFKKMYRIRNKGSQYVYAHGTNVSFFTFVYKKRV